MTTIPVLIPLRYLDGYDVWIGNDLAGAVWTDRWGTRWVVTWDDHNKPFKTGCVDDIATAIKMIVANR